MAFCRISDKAIRLREPVMTPDVLIIQDQTLIHQSTIFEGLSPKGFVLLNSPKSFEELGLGDLVTKLGPDHCRTVNASEIAQGHIGRPLPNAALLGGLVALTGLVSLVSVNKAVREKFPGAPGEKNVLAAAEAYEWVKHPEVQHAGSN
jgi:pyruvate ferredoxin oxidoreductase gamma subunit